MAAASNVVIASGLLVAAVLLAVGATAQPATDGFTLFSTCKTVGTAQQQCWGWAIENGTWAASTYPSFQNSWTPAKVPIASAYRTSGVSMNQYYLPEWPSLYLTGELAYLYAANATLPIVTPQGLPPYPVSSTDAKVMSRFGVGYLEGYLSFRHIYYTFQTHVDPYLTPGWMRRWVENHLTYLENLSGFPTATNPACRWRDNPYCPGFVDIDKQIPSPVHRAAFLQVMQFYGFVLGYQQAVLDYRMPYLRLSHFQLFWTAFKNDMDVIYKVNAPPPTSVPKYAYMMDILAPRVRGYSLIALASEDIYIGHNTIDGYTRMARYVKTYRFPEGKITMTATAGYWGSGDDMIVTSHGLAITGTPLIIPPSADLKARFPQSLSGDPRDLKAGEDIAPNVILSQMRLMVASTSANSAADFAQIMAQNASGTHVAQYGVVDIKRVSSSFLNIANPHFGSGGSPFTHRGSWRSTGALLEGFFTLVEEGAQGVVESKAHTSDLMQDGYHECHGLPVSVTVSRSLGLLAAQVNCTYGSYFDRLVSPVAIMTTKELYRVGFTGLTAYSFKSVLQHNDFTEDPDQIAPTCEEYEGDYPACRQVDCDADARSPLLAMAPRGDLVPDDDDNMYGALHEELRQRNEGAIDSKVISVANLLSQATLVAELPPSGTPDPYAPKRVDVSDITVNWNLFWGPTWSVGSPSLPAFDWYKLPHQFRRLLRYGQQNIVRSNWVNVEITVAGQPLVQGGSAGFKGRVAVIAATGSVLAALAIVAVIVTAQMTKRSRAARSSVNAASASPVDNVASPSGNQRDSGVGPASVNERQSLLGR